MSGSQHVTWDANEATSDVAYRINEVISIYPITPASPMGEWADTWAAQRRPNLWGDIPQVTEMQSEGGAAGAVHGALQAGSLTTTFTASQGLLLMIPNMYKIAGELTPAVIHISARTLATHALSIFGDHSDVYSARGTGFGMLASNSVQEAHDFALISQAASLKCRVPFLHFFDGFRTSHEVSKTQRLSDDDLLALLDQAAIDAFRARRMTPDAPVLRGTAQNPDHFFQAREAISPFYVDCADIVQGEMDAFAARTGRDYKLYDYVGHPEAERVVVLMGSGAEAVHETVEWMAARGEKVGAIKVRLFRPFSATHLAEALPATVKTIGVLDRAKEPGAGGEPLYMDIITALHQLRRAGVVTTDPAVVGGRYGLSSKEFTPAMIVGIFAELAKDDPKDSFTVGIFDDVSHSSLDWDDDLDIEADDVMRAVFVGLGADGTVGANKNSIKIIGEETDNHAQGYFVYDSKKSGAVTTSHLRFGPRPIRSSYLIRKAKFVACHQWVFIEKLKVEKYAEQGATFLMNSPYGPDEVWDHLPRALQQAIIDKDMKVFVIDAYNVAREANMGGRINTVMQTCFFAISGVLPRDEAIGHIKKAIKKTYGKKGEEIVQMNYAAVDSTLAALSEVAVPAEVTSTFMRPPVVSDEAPDFVQRVTAKIMAGDGDLLPVSAFPPDGTWPTHTTRWEKRTVAQEIPIWDASICTQCNKCVSVCPHAAIRAKVATPEALEAAPEGFRSIAYKAKDYKGMEYMIQVAPEDCTGCTLCARVCPARDKTRPKHKALDMEPLRDHLDVERTAYDFFLDLPDVDRTEVRPRMKDTQFLRPLFEYSGACAGCGETPYVKLMSQLYGDRLMIANATGCSSIYGGNLPTTPFATDENGRGPTWSNSLFEDNAEFGLGFRLAVDQLTSQAQRLVGELGGVLGGELVEALLSAEMDDEASIAAQRKRVDMARAKLAGNDTFEARQLDLMADYLVRKSVWILGGDGWAYDIGFGGLDHVLASDSDVNILVMDTEVYSNTGGQASKATPLGATAKFAAAGKPMPKKDLGMLAMTYGSAYVAQIALGSKDTQTLKAFTEAESYRGPSIILAYSHCIAHGFNLEDGLDQQKKAVMTGYWPLYRFDPRLVSESHSGLTLDSRPPRMDLTEFAYNEGRYGMLLKADPERAKMLMTAAQADVIKRFERLQAFANSRKAK
jgi:pyruvate-ferredoxin/flavodoxin oxidoreductase